MAQFADDAVAETIAERSGEDVSDLDFFTFRDPDESVRDDADRIRSLSQIPADTSVSGHVRRPDRDAAGGGSGGVADRADAPFSAAPGPLRRPGPGPHREMFLSVRIWE